MMIKQLMIEHGSIQAQEILCYWEKEIDAVENIEVIHFKTEFGDLFLQVTQDTDELFWTKSFENFENYILSDFQFNLTDIKIVNYWHMINHMGYDDAVQFEIKSTPKNCYIQIIAIASQMEILQFN